MENKSICFRIRGGKKNETWEKDEKMSGPIPFPARVLWGAEGCSPGGSDAGWWTGAELWGFTLRLQEERKVSVDVHRATQAAGKVPGPASWNSPCSRNQCRETLLAVGTSVVKLSLQSGRGDIPAALARWDPVKLNRLCPDQAAYRHRNHNSQLVVTDRLVPARALYLSSQEGRFLTASSQ